MKLNSIHQSLFEKQNRIGKLILLCFASVLFACNFNSEKSQSISAQVKESVPSVIAKDDSLEVLVNSILEISAKDFSKNQHPQPRQFRNVQFKYIIKPNKEILYILCGQFATSTKEEGDEWTQFATIKNSDYEQWIGPNGLTYCENSIEIPYSKTDLAIDLLNKLVSIENTGK